MARAKYRVRPRAATAGGRDWLAILTAAAAVGTFIVGSVGTLLGAAWIISAQFNKIDSAVNTLSGRIQALEVRVGTMDDRLQKVESVVDGLRYADK